MEATSLSSITRIAAEPPSSPSQGTSVIPLRPLILYIARVPGSQDVFLTTLKPREKVVSAEDVQNSLYYVHISREEDLDKIDDDQSPAESCSPMSTYAPIVQDGRIVRKPAPPPRPLSMPVTSYSPTDQNGSEIRIARKAIGTARQVPSPQRTDSPILPFRPRRPLPAIPQDDAGPSNEMYGRPFDHQSEPPHANYENQSPRQNRIRSTSEPNQDIPNTDFGSLTLIRRDPVSCEQWNVANISDMLALPGVDSLAGNNFRRSRLQDRRAGVSLEITILNPSYQQFLSDNEHGDLQVQDALTSSTVSSQPSRHIFRRQLHPSDRFPLSPNALYSSPPLLPTIRSGEPEPTPTTQKRRLFRRSADVSSKSSHRKPVHSQQSSTSSSSVYNFLSPWGTTCEFTASKVGNNLRCRHRLPNEPYDSPVELSELRFNLPNSNKTTIRPRSAFAAGAVVPNSDRRPHSSLSLSTSTNNPHDDDDDDDDFDDHDVRILQNLGQEKAGGGFGGKQAKLGKLIIWPDGVQMLDLLVAANVGLWWRAWEKVG